MNLIKWKFPHTAIAIHNTVYVQCALYSASYSTYFSETFDVEALFFSLLLRDVKIGANPWLFPFFVLMTSTSGSPFLSDNSLRAFLDFLEGEQMG